jgi:hypothetical protein
VFSVAFSEAFYGSSPLSFSSININVCIYLKLLILSVYGMNVLTVSNSDFEKMTKVIA